MNKLGSETSRALDITATPAQIDAHVAALGPSKLMQGLPERGDARLPIRVAVVGVHQNCDATHPIRLLRARSERPCCRATEQRYEFPPLHSMTSSASASSLSGTSRAIAFAALRLITSSNLVGCSTGSSVGGLPLRIISTYSAARRYICRRLTPYEINPPASGNALLPYTIGSRVVMARSAICRRVLTSNASSSVRRPGAPAFAAASTPVRT